ncbi:hypothetical protein DSM43518_04775 [Mycobacterium marinum]|uniref:Uncharacterized protein n=1 Tax=Mycobacterium marinum TaxID=1781 RepID=A0A2Z5YJ78_MYCMR|nr:hypothetical protein [Mycobacterium marinum]AXN51233.1 hypothetical protein CCUG20998_03837 [Mycobacterium marinum]RFZ02788.1 hypothetical protein DSM43518_04775 [Mycobacterium marinum]RFZ25979.1 hypothetical protein DSM43519_01293 [Mycobacterium marinum]RFZ28858.1 hypothetical protein DSM44344_01125 [Mycobacterium marinum]RFZ39044.1 hypothetical protein NCTC2275_00312 [Mycobacterium marinum]
MAKSYGRLTELNSGLVRLRDNVKDVKSDYERLLDTQMVLTSVEGESYMKDHAPWRDSTGNRKDRVPGETRSALHTTTSLKGAHKVIRFSHGVAWGIWLEIKNNGKDQIIMPSVAVMAKRLMKSLRGSLSELRKRA